MLADTPPWPHALTRRRSWTGGVSACAQWGCFVRRPLYFAWGGACLVRAQRSRPTRSDPQRCEPPQPVRMYMTASMPMPHASPMLPWRSGPSEDWDLQKIGTFGRLGPSEDWDHLRLPDHNHTHCPCHPLGPLRCTCFPRAFLHRPVPVQMHRPSLPASPRPCSDAQASHKHSCIA